MLCLCLQTSYAQQRDDNKLNTAKQRKPAKNNSKLKNYTGDRKVTPSRSKNNDSKVGSYSGDVRQGSSGTGRKAPRHNNYVSVPAAKTQKSADKLKNYTGDSKIASSKSQGPRNVGGTVVVNNKNQSATSKQMSKYQGDAVVGQSRMEGPRNKGGGYVVVNDKKMRVLSKKMSKYQGDVIPNESRSEGPRNSGTSVVAIEVDRKQAKRVANYRGDLPNNYLEKRAAFRRKKDKKNANYQGDILVKTLRARDRRARIKSKKIANYQGDIIVKRVKKGMHPSAVYKGGKVKNSYAAKERYRKRMLKKNGKKSGIEDANYQKKKAKDPKYDKKESEIWY